MFCQNVAIRDQSQLQSTIDVDFVESLSFHEPVTKYQHQKIESSVAHICVNAPARHMLHFAMILLKVYGMSRR